MPRRELVGILWYIHTMMFYLVHMDVKIVMIFFDFFKSKL